MGSNIKVVLIEDDAGIRDALQMVLENSGYTVDAYAEGTAIIEDNFELPGIFIIDKQLSGVDGLDICKHLKAHARSKHLPVIIISASPDTLKFATLACADAFMEKPFKNKALLQKISELTAVEKSPPPTV